MSSTEISDRIIESLYGRDIDSTNRLRHMLRALAFQPAEIFWPVFNEVWPSCDNTFFEQHDLKIFLRRHRKKMPQFLPGENQRFYEALPSKLTIYRGCSRSRLRGLSWTTDIDVAARFAHGHRSISVPDPVIACANISKHSILAVACGRGESEVLVPVTKSGKVIDYDEWLEAMAA